jgi:N-acyl-phosphatidylethanolamine-hydrolysing phospholipase D
VPREETGRAGKKPAHHGPDGRFRIPWTLEVAGERSAAALLRWQWERLRKKLPPNPDPALLPRGVDEVAYPRAAPGELRITWIGHASFLVQLGGRNLLLDPHFGERASPFRRLGPKRFVPPGISLESLPPIDAVVLSHDHYDHLDLPTVRALNARFGEALRWIAPLGHAAWLRSAGVGSAVDVDWWEAVELPGVRVTCAPAQHWTRRRLREMNDRLWGSFALRGEDGRAVYFGGDSGYFRGYREIGRRLGPFDATLMPVGAYEPRWFMAAAHMNPEEAVRAYRELGEEGVFVPMHWGTFRLTDEDPLEPPARVRAAWRETGLPEERLRVLRHGETLVLPGG